MFIAIELNDKRVFLLLDFSIVCIYILSMRFEWDIVKSNTNRIKHGISFPDATKVFEGPILSAPDERFDYGEDRFICIGQIGVRTIVVSYTERKGKVRLISARKATKSEREYYEKEIFG